MARIYRGIVVVHGVGEHTKGSYVSGFVEELAKFLCNVPELSDGKVQLTARNRTDTSDTSWATIHIKNPDAAKPDEEWHIREAWWTRTFQPSKPGRIYLWAILAGLALLWSAWVQQARRGWLAFRNPAKLAQWPTERIGRPFDRANHVPLPPAEQGVWRQPSAGTAKSVLDAVVWLVLTSLYVVLGAIGLLLIGVVYLLLVLPLSHVFPAFANQLLKVLTHLIVFTLGDQEAMTTRQLALAAAANEVNTGLWNMLSADGMRSRRNNDEEFEGYETVSVVAHSGGCVVSMAALKSADFARFRDEAATFRRGNQAVDFHRPGRINWVTVGSGLNLAWNVRFGKGAADRALWQRPLDRVNWLNLYARYDPVSQGPAPAGMVASLAGPDPEAVPLRASADAAPAPRPPFAAVRVANTDSPWGDHGAYWSNHAEVMSRVVHVLTDSRFASEPLSPDETGVGAKNLAALESAIASHVDVETPKWRRAVTAAMVRVLAGVGVFAALVAWAGDEVGRWLLGAGDLPGLGEWAPGGHRLENALSSKFALGGNFTLRDYLVGALALGFVAMLALEFNNLRRWLAGFARTRETGRQRRLWWLATGVVLAGTLFAVAWLTVLWPTGTLP